MPASLDSLVDNILLQILDTLSVRALLALRTTARRYYILGKRRCVWHARYRTDVLARCLPLPGPPVPPTMLSAAELERRTTRALHLARAWPRLSARTLVAYGRRVDQVVFVHGGVDLLTVGGDTVTRWRVVSWPGGGAQLKHLGAWTPREGVACRVVKDGDVIAVGPRDARSPRFAMVASTSVRAPFVTLHEDTRVSGMVVGLWRHLLLLDATEQGGGLEVRDWRAQTPGKALLPCLPDAFGHFLDFVVFSGHLLVVRERCVSVFPIPDVPAEGQVVVGDMRVFVFQEAVARPVVFTTCVVRAEAQEAGWRPTLTIAARMRRLASGVSMVMLVPLGDDKGPFAYRMTYLPPHLPATRRGDPQCTAVCLGPSGRGVYVVGREVRLVGPGLLIMPPYEMQLGPVFEEEVVYVTGRRWEGGSVDFDEGMGRCVVANECGFDVVEFV